jgi:hypothetical protein
MHTGESSQVHCAMMKRAYADFNFLVIIPKEREREKWIDQHIIHVQRSLAWAVHSKRPE